MNPASRFPSPIVASTTLFLGHDVSSLQRRFSRVADYIRSSFLRVLILGGFVLGPVVLRDLHFGV